MLSGQLILDLLNHFQRTLVVLGLRYVTSSEDTPWAATQAFLAERSLQLEKIPLCYLMESGNE